MENINENCKKKAQKTTGKDSMLKKQMEGQAAAAVTATKSKTQAKIKARREKK